MKKRRRKEDYDQEQTVDEMEDEEEEEEGRLGQNSLTMDSRRGRGVRKKNCRNCGYYGQATEDDLCPNCDEGGDRARRTPPPARTPPRQQQPDVCRKCLNRVEEEDEGIQCDNCDAWFHPGCEEIGARKLSEIKNEPERPWFCKECEPRIRANLVEMRRLRMHNEEMKKELRELKDNRGNADERLKNLERTVEEAGQRQPEVSTPGRGWKQELALIKRQMEELQGKMDEVDRRWEQREKNLKQEIKDFMEAKMEEMMSEREDREGRKKNVVMFHVPEPDTRRSIKEQQNQDKAACLDIINNELGIEEVERVEVIRMEKKNQRRLNGDRRARPLLVKLADDYLKWKVVKEAKKLRESRKEEYQRIIIIPDMTLKERDREKVLRDQLKEKRDKGERGWYISRGQLVQGNF